MRRARSMSLVLLLAAAAPAGAQPGAATGAPVLSAGEARRPAEAAHADGEVPPAGAGAPPAAAPEIPARRVAAAPGATPAPPVDPPPAAAPPQGGLAGYAAADATGGEPFLTTGGLTGARGSSFVRGWFPLYPVVGAVSVGMAVHDRVEVSAGGLAIADFVDGDDLQGGVGFVRVKVSLLRRPTLAVAASGALVRVAGGERFASGIVGASVCPFGRSCRTVVSTSLTLVPDGDAVNGGGNAGPALHVAATGAVVTRLGHGPWRAVAEAVLLGAVDQVLAMGYVGVRYARPSWTVDAGFPAVDLDGEVLVVPLPLLSATRRF